MRTIHVLAAIVLMLLVGMAIQHAPNRRPTTTARLFRAEPDWPVRRSW
jgi:hypothetical protein